MNKKISLARLEYSQENLCKLLEMLDEDEKEQIFYILIGILYKNGKDSIN